MNRSIGFCLLRSRGRIAPHIMDDVAEALKAVGCRAAVLDMEAQGIYAAQTPAEIEKAAGALRAWIADFRPDFIISYGLAGIIGTGRDSHLWEDLRIPYLLFFFDMPVGHEAFFRTWRASELMTVFCWDRRYQGWFETLGVKRCFHLPLGTNPRVFGKAFAAQDGEVSFVGSLDARYLDCDLPCAGALRLVRERFLKLKAEQPCIPFEDLLAQAANAGGSGSEPAEFRAFMKTADYARFTGDLLQQADARYRLKAISRAAADGPVRVFGNSDWAARLPAAVTFAGAVAYGRELADVYRASVINLNLTNSHLQTAVNQRVFDCPAAGGFLLTDYREDIERFFEPGREIICFKTLEEMAGLLERYRQSPRELQNIALAAQRRVLAEHTWDCRMRTMIGILK